MMTNDRLEAIRAGVRLDFERGASGHAKGITADRIALLAEVDRLRSLVEGIGSDRLKDCDGAEELARQERERVVAIIDRAAENALVFNGVWSAMDHVRAEVTGASP